MEKKTATNPLWTRDFTIITAGSVVSMFGNSNNRKVSGP